MRSMVAGLPIAGVAFAAALAPVLDRDCAGAGSGAAQAGVGIRQHRRPERPLGGALRGSGKGHPAPALRELPPGRRPAAQGMDMHAAPAAGHPRRRGLRRSGHDLQHLPWARQCSPSPGRPTTSRASPAIPHWHLAPIEMAWAGQIARRDLRADQGSGAERRQGPRRRSSSTWRMTASSAGAGTRAKAASRCRARRQAFGELIKYWAETGAVCPS